MDAEEKQRMLLAAEAELDEKMKKDTRCGVGSCKSKKGASVALFSLNLSAIVLFHVALFSYAIGTLRTVEKRFELSSAEVGLLGSINDFLQIFTVLLAGYFGRKTNKPRFIAVTIIATVLGAYLTAAPYFIYGPKKYDPALLSTFAKASEARTSRTTIAPINPEARTVRTSFPPFNVAFPNVSARMLSSGSMFGKKQKSLQICSPGAEPAKCSETSQKEKDSNRAAFYIFAVAQILFGIGMSGIGTLGLSYIDENVKKEDSALHVAIVTSMYPLSPIIGFSLAAVSTKMTEDFSDVPLPFYHPQFVGNWWLGYIVMGTLILISAFPMFMFPKHMEAYYTIYKKPRVIAAIKESTTKSNESKKSASSVIATHLKGFPLALWNLVSNPAYLSLIMCKVAGVYFVVGLIINLPRYMMVHFGKPAYVANIVSAIAGAVGGATGNILGGIIMKKMRLKPRGSAFMLIISIGTTVVGLLIFMLIRCPQVPFAGQPDANSGIINVTMPCNANCSCSRDKYQPMCSSEGVMYFSPCHAGCTQSLPNGTYTNCACLQDGETLKAGVCRKSCETGFYGYIVTYFIFSFIASMGRTPATILMFRVVPEDLKAFSLSFGSFLFNLLVFVPGPIMFGLLFDSTCLVWGEKCGSRGACYIYNTKDYRHYMHGVTLSFQTVSLILSFVAAYFIHKLFAKGGKLYDGNKDTELHVRNGQPDSPEKEKLNGHHA